MGLRTAVATKISVDPLCVFLFLVRRVTHDVEGYALARRPVCFCDSSIN